MKFASSTTQAGSGEITPAAAHCSTSQAFLSGKGAAVVEPPKPGIAPAAACSDETTHKHAKAGTALRRMLEAIYRRILGIRIITADQHIADLESMVADLVIEKALATAELHITRQRLADAIAARNSLTNAEVTGRASAACEGPR